MKPLLILSTLLTVGAAALAVMVRSSLKDLREEKDNLNRSTLALHDQIRESITEINATNDTYVETAKNSKNEELQTKSLQTDIKGKQDELTSIGKAIEDLGARKQAMQEDITRILGNSGTPEEILARNEELKRENDAKVEELENVSKEAEVAKRAATESDNMITRLREQQSTRAKAISLASSTGTISAVNYDLGFVVVNLGQNQGVTSESRLLVKRGNQLIGKLKVVQIYGNTTVADISPNSTTPGFSIQPGDKVIFENSPT